MYINKRFFPDTLPDNEETYISLLIGYIESIDELCYLEISKLREGYHFRIAPSTPKYSQPLLKEILKFNNKYGIHLDMSKSIKVTNSIDFLI